MDFGWLIKRIGYLMSESLFGSEVCLFKVVVIGFGFLGFYVVGVLLNWEGLYVEVDVFDCLFIFYGLVWGGVVFDY